MSRSTRRFLLLGAALSIAASTVVVWWRFDNDLDRALLRAGQGSVVIATRCGRIEYQVAGTASDQDHRQSRIFVEHEAARRSANLQDRSRHRVVMEIVRDSPWRQVVLFERGRNALDRHPVGGGIIPVGQRVAARDRSLAAGCIGKLELKGQELSGLEGWQRRTVYRFEVE